MRDINTPKLMNLLLFALLLSTGVLALPDFTISNINATPSSPCFGQDAVVTFTLNNIGNMNAQSVPVGVYNAGNLLGTVNLDVSASSSKNGIIAVPFSSNYNLNVKANPSCSITEANCNNNLAVYGAWFGTSCSSVFTDTTLRRFFKSSIHDHFYTISSYHAQNAVANGYVEETSPGKVSSTWFSGSVPLYRFWNPYPNEIHYYTTSNSQILGPILQGFAFEGIEGYIYPSQQSGTTPLYHLYHQSYTDHLYTINSNEKQTAISTWGFLDQSYIGYVKGTDPSLATTDLAVNDIWLDSGATGGQPAKIWANIINAGSSTSETITVSIYVDGVYKNQFVVYGLAQDSGYTNYITATVAAGTHSVRAALSANVNDANPSNNERTESLVWAQPVQQKPAPKTASFSTTTPAQGSTVTYTYNLQATPMDSNYRSMVHFLDDSNDIIINDDHNLIDVKGFTTNSGSFSGLISYSRPVTIPSNFSGRLRMTVGFYNLSTPNVRAVLNTSFVSELWYGEYLVGEINVPQQMNNGKPAPKAASFSNSNPLSGSTVSYTYNIQATPTDTNYRSMVHFLDDSGNIVVNDDHWLKDVKSFTTNSSSF